ncbi:shikimate dehydrogenase [Bacillus halotolerans]|uniref:Shikimate dehydrogenase (NADP(+)) n=1 Tax=Bacillus halotolerans TaxID=260554 RepID=A0ABY7HWB7_9BACI|nr:shikimate dehydrogenase [Bacillus halotolerans]MBT9249655.1 shikimate dehydrogenase [Bacillus halotolerans]MCR6597697.1 shikimate dehydrogenase [Bacillus halotolerans]MDG0766774.1 shikimate dehydrogenase [Bacillus halotolerans]MDL5611697.1 shikimate dehydrogenase [Bacillus halotolerans]MEC1407569.1 shikimate dehydrogenase [Bacillus halotolerans]
MKKLYGVIGNPIAHSMSPDIHNAALKDLGLDGHYHAFKVEENSLEDAVKGIRALGVQGINVTVPHKVSIMDHLDHIDESAKVLGAVNTVRREGDKLVGYNTDGEGFVKSLMRILDKPISELSFLMIGAGGAARAIFTTIVRDNPEKFDICNRTIEKAKQLAESAPSFRNVEVLSIKEAEERLEQYDVMIHTTSVGMYPNVEDIPLSLQRAASSAVVCDIVYNPIQTSLLKEAKQKGLKTLDGVGMFVEQAALSFRLWTGHEPDVEKMRSIVVGKLGGK